MSSISPKKTLGVVLVAGGSSSRMKGQDKMTLTLKKKPLLSYSIQSFLQLPQTKQIVIVARKDLLPFFAEITSSFQTSLPISLVEGGASRQESVFAGVEKLQGRVDYYAIHDGARPLIHPLDIENSLAAAVDIGGATLGTPLTDTVKLVDEKMRIQKTLPRHLLYGVQTPQIFEAHRYHKAMELALRWGESYTDDCQLLEAAGFPVVIVQNQHPNQKLTLPEDIPLLEQLLGERKGG